MLMTHEDKGENTITCCKSGFILVVNPQGEASNCESLHSTGLRSVAHAVHKILSYEQTLSNTISTHETDTNKYISQLQVMKKFL